MSAKRNGMSTIGALGVAFVVLKLCGVIDWSWWFVLLPFYGALAAVGLIFIIALLFAILHATFNK